MKRTAGCQLLNRQIKMENKNMGDNKIQIIVSHQQIIIVENQYFNIIYCILIFLFPLLSLYFKYKKQK